MRYLLIALLLTACATPDGWRIRAAEAEIAEMRRDCLKRKQADPAVDCSQYQGATTIRVR